MVGLKFGWYVHESCVLQNYNYKNSTAKNTWCNKILLILLNCQIHCYLHSQGHTIKLFNIKNPGKFVRWFKVGQHLACWKLHGMMNASEQVLFFPLNFIVSASKTRDVIFRNQKICRRKTVVVFAIILFLVPCFILPSVDSLYSYSLTHRHCNA